MPQYGAGAEEIKTRLKEILACTSFVKTDLSRPIDYFLYGIEPVGAVFSSDNHPAAEYWKLVRLFSLADYRSVINKKARLLSFNQTESAAVDVIDYGNSAILLSWLQYRLNNNEAARKALYKNIAGVCGSFFDYSYKSKILFEGRNSEFYHPAFYNFFDGGILFASIKSNNGDCSKVVKDIFDYLTILYQ